MAILGQLDGAALLNREVPTIHSRSIGAAIDQWDVSGTNQESVREFFRAAPGDVRTTMAFTATGRYDTLDLDRGWRVGAADGESVAGCLHCKDGGGG